MKKFDWNSARRIADRLCEAVFAVGVAILPTIISDGIERVRDSRPVGYDDAVNTIINSSMLSSYKSTAVKALRRDGDDSYYRAVIRIVNSDMLGSNKIELIDELSNN